MNDVTLVYFEGCPEAKNIRAALLNAGVYDFKVVLQDQLPENDPLRKLSSPSVLHGKDLVYGVLTGGEISSCTFDAENRDSESALVEKFRKLKDNSSNQKGKLRSFLGPGLAALLVLKCPACIPGIVALLSVLGLGFVLTQTVLKSILIVLLLITLAGFFFSYFKRHRNFYPLILGSVFSVGLYISRFHSLEGISNQILTYLTVAGLIGITLWDLRLSSKKSCIACLP